MSDGTNVIYEYDGTFEGLLCCVYESVTADEIPSDIAADGEEQISLYPKKRIATDLKIYNAVFKKLFFPQCREAEELVKTAFLYGEGGKSLAIFNFLLKLNKEGKSAVYTLQDEVTAKIQAMARAVSNEAHLMKGFIRFADYNGNLATEIAPKHIILPLLRGHFSARFPQETFLIYDKAHEMALVYQPYTTRIISVYDFVLPPADDAELQMRALWTGYFEAIAIKERTNPTCQRTHMPKRFWTNMTEMQWENKQNAELAGAKGLSAIRQSDKLERLKASEHGTENDKKTSLSDDAAAKPYNNTAEASDGMVSDSGGECTVRSCGIPYNIACKSR